MPLIQVIQVLNASPASTEKKRQLLSGGHVRGSHGDPAGYHPCHNSGDTRENWSVSGISLADSGQDESRRSGVAQISSPTSLLTRRRSLIEDLEGLMGAAI